MTNYSLNRWDRLTLFCDDGRIEISNVLAENALRCVALGRRNFVFARSDSLVSGPPRCIAWSAHAN
jgi:transposase